MAIQYNNTRSRAKMPGYLPGAFGYNQAIGAMDNYTDPNNASGLGAQLNPRANAHTGETGMYGALPNQAPPPTRGKMPSAQAPPPPDPNLQGQLVDGTQQQTVTDAVATAGEGGANLKNATKNTLAADALGSLGQIGGTIIGKQFQDWSTGGSEGMNALALKQGKEMGELNNQLKKAGTFATNGMGYKGAGAQISAKNAMAGFQPDAEDVMARNQANKQADKAISGLQGQMAATNAATGRQAGRAVDSTLKAAKQMGGPASLGAAAAGQIGQTLGESALARNAQNAQAVQGANQSAASMRAQGASAFDQAKNSAFGRKVQPYMNQWHDPGSGIDAGVNSSISSSRQAGDYPIYDLLAGTATQLADRGAYQGSVDKHGTDISNITTTIDTPTTVETPLQKELGTRPKMPSANAPLPPTTPATASPSNVDQSQILQKQMTGNSANPMQNQLDLLTGKSWMNNVAPEIGGRAGNRSPVQPNPMLRSGMDWSDPSQYGNLLRGQLNKKPTIPYRR